MPDFPDCPQCGGSLTYSDGTRLACPECGHEWMPGESSDEGAAQVRDSNGNPLAQGDTVVVIKDLKVKGSSIPLKQGTVIIEFTISADGTARVTWPPVRPSGIDEFDRNCADAIRRASPFEPLPASLREGGRTMLKIRAPFVAKNPIIK